MISLDSFSKNTSFSKFWMRLFEYFRSHVEFFFKNSNKYKNIMISQVELGCPDDVKRSISADKLILEHCNYSKS